MTNTPAMEAVRFVLKQYVSSETYREGARNVRRASFHMDVDELMPVIQFIVDKHGCTPEQAMNQFITMRDETVQAEAKSPNNMNTFVAVLISLFVAILPVILFNTQADRSVWMPVIGAVIGSVAFFIMFFLLAWRPRQRAMQSVWMGGGTPAERLEELSQIKASSLGEVLGKYQKKQATAFVLIALLVIGGFTFFSAQNASGKQQFHDALAGVTVSEDNAGTRYAVYDTEKRMYVDRYLSEKNKALTAEDVRAVFRISEGEKVVGSYEGQGKAYKRYVTISLVDQRTGETVLREYVYGGEPPHSISVKAGQKNKNGYGSHPSEADIGRMCARMIEEFEKMR